ncbi:MAG: hydroxysqualene dehydroxylase HpnE [Rhodoferax sp.]|nr:hydroxysqualene dehydroxylase HpnE [Rhodoferax sp.]
MKIAIVGAGWAGMAAAVQATQDGHHATVFEAARAVGGRARALNGTMPDGHSITLDNGQHILIGAYTDTLALMRKVGVDPARTLLRLPLCLQFPDGDGIALPDWPSPLDALAGMATAKGWSWADKGSLLRASLRWQWGGFRCAAGSSVADLCHGLTPTVVQTLIDPLCVSALNTLAAQASGQVFLTVLRDSLFGTRGSSNLLLPTTDLGALFPEAAAAWLQAHGGAVQLGTRVDRLTYEAGDNGQSGWSVNGQHFDAVLWATSSSNAASALIETAQAAPETIANSLRAWAETAQALRFEAIATVYTYAPSAHLPQPMLALRNTAEHPAQFVFDRAQLGGPRGVLAWVVSASQGDRAELEAGVLAQAQAQLGALLSEPPSVLQTVIEKRATFACTPGLQRPTAAIAPGLWACGDFVEGPYPATLEGAVRSGLAAARALAMPARSAAPL